MENSVTKNTYSFNGRLYYPGMGLRPKNVAGMLSKPTLQEIINYNSRSLASSIKKWQERSEKGTGKQTTPERKALQNLTGKTGECIWYGLYSIRFPDLTLPDFEVYEVGYKTYLEDMFSQVGNFSVGIKTKELFDANEYGLSWSFQDDDEKVFGKLKSNQYISGVMADLNVLDGKTPKPKPQMNKVGGRIYFCVQTQWLRDHDLFAADDHYHEGKLVVRYNNHFIDSRTGKETDSILEVVQKYYGGDMNILWQL